MKFLVTVTPRRQQVPPPPIFDAAIAWIEGQLKNKTMDCCYSFVTGGGVAVSNADSAEAMLKLLMSYPAYPFVDFRVEPLCNVVEALRETKAMVQRIAAASA